jgi:mono/diheme cytochrome c family protein
MKFMKTLLVLLVVAVLGFGAFIWFGVYNVAADDPHWSTTYRFMETLRARSIQRRAADITVPALDDATMIRGGAGNYNSMCVSCHLAPGASDTELSLGLYPVPPTWSELGNVEPREAFWAIKHGIKMSGMPAWGKSMDDRYIWGMVALMQQFPRMTAADYSALVDASPGHSHGGGETGVRGDPVPDGGHADHADEPSPRSSFEPINDPTDDGAEYDSDDDHSH